MNRHSQEATGIKVLKEILGSLKITEDYVSDGNRTTESALEEMLTTLALVLYNKTTQAVMPKIMVLDPG